MTKKIDAKIIKKIKKMRKTMSQERIARILNLSLGTVRKYEKEDIKKAKEKRTREKRKKIR